MQTLQDRIVRIDYMQGRRFSRLKPAASDIAREGIVRYLRACRRMDIPMDVTPVREIIDDALKGRRVFAETENDLLV